MLQLRMCGLGIFFLPVWEARQWMLDNFPIDIIRRLTYTPCLFVHFCGSFVALSLSGFGRYTPVKLVLRSILRLSHSLFRLSSLWWATRGLYQKCKQKGVCQLSLVALLRDWIAWDECKSISELPALTFFTLCQLYDISVAPRWCTLRKKVLQSTFFVASSCHK